MNKTTNNIEIENNFKNDNDFYQILSFLLPFINSQKFSELSIKLASNGELNLFFYPIFILHQKLKNKQKNKNSLITEYAKDEIELYNGNYAKYEELFNGWKNIEYFDFIANKKEILDLLNNKENKDINLPVLFKTKTGFLSYNLETEENYNEFYNKIVKKYKIKDIKVFKNLELFYTYGSGCLFERLLNEKENNKNFFYKIFKKLKLF